MVITIDYEKLVWFQTVGYELTGKNISKKYNDPKKDKPANIEIEKAFYCDAIDVPDKKTNKTTKKKQSKIKSDDTSGYISINKEMFKDFLKFLDDKWKSSDIKEIDKDGNLNRDEYRDKIMPGWREFLRLSR